MKNYIGQGLFFSFLVLLMAGALSFVPDGLRVGPFSLRKMDIFSAIRLNPPAAPVEAAAPEPYYPDSSAVWPADDSLTAHLALSAPKDSLLTPGPLPPVDSAFFGNIIEDYTFEQLGLSRFFEAVDSIAGAGRIVRVAFYGDSFVEGDILIGDLRDTLQSAWGGAGVGFVPITSEVAQFKRSLKHQYKGWKVFSIVKNREAKVPFGLNGFVYYPGPDASVTYEGAPYFKHTRRWTNLRLFYRSGNPFSFLMDAGRGAAQPIHIQTGGSFLGCWKYDVSYPGMERVSLRFPEADSLLLFGACLESGPGIYIDNFSVRGNTGGPLQRINPGLVRAFDRHQQYDLVIVQLGLNAVGNSLDNLNWYRAELDRTYAHLKACFPGKTLLVISVGDRGGKIGMEYATMRSVPYIVAMQRELARKHGLLFFDLYRGMGGSGAMIAMANRRPMLANKDFTHLTHEGGKVVGHKFAALLLREHEKWKSPKSGL